MSSPSTSDLLERLSSPPSLGLWSAVGSSVGAPSGSAVVSSVDAGTSLGGDGDDCQGQVLPCVCNGGGFLFHALLWNRRKVWCLVAYYPAITENYR